MIAISIDTAYRFKFPVVNIETGKFITGLTIAYSLVKTSDGIVITSGNCSEVGNTGIYYFDHTYTVAMEYDVIITTPIGYYDGFETIMVEEAVDISASLTSYGVAKVSDLSGLSTLTAAQVWSELLTGITTVGSIGKLIKDNLDSQISLCSTLTAQQVWNELTTALVTPNSIGKLIVDNIDTKLSDLPTLFWSKIIDGTYTADKVLKIMAAILSGKTVIVDTGNDTAIVTFRNLDNTSDVVKANMNKSQRIIMTLTP